MNAPVSPRKSQGKSEPSGLAYMLDTNIVSYYVRGQYPRLNQRMLPALEQRRCCVSVLTYAELRFGFTLNPLAIKHQSRTERLLVDLTVHPWEQHAADAYALVKTTLWRQGQPIGELDMQIAAHALAENLTLVTHNTKHFEGIAGLKLEDWTL